MSIPTTVVDDNVQVTEPTQKKKHRKEKVLDAQEDNNIDYEFAGRLDMSCIDGITAPSINDAFVLKYTR